VLGNLLRVSRDRLGLMAWAAQEYGDAVQLRMGPKVLYLFNHPDHAKHILSDHQDNYRKGIGLVHARRALGDGLLTSDGARWRRQRRAVQPVFQRDRIAQAASVVVAEAEKLAARWRQRVGGTLDVVTEMTQLTLGVLGRSLLQTDLGSSGQIGRAFEMVQNQAMFEMVTLNLVPSWLPLPTQVRFRRARRQLDSLVDQLISGRSVPAGGDDLLSRLIAATAGEGDPRHARRQIRDELVTILLAGHETTASTLGWTWYLVDQRPDVADRLRAEAQETLGGRPPAYDDLPKLTYTSMVIEEAMRLYPPVWMLTRRAVGDDEVGGFHVPAGADVLICPYTLHRHPRFWERPDQFMPERFSPEGSRDRPRYAYLPFGAGPRFCVGSHLGMMEAVLVVAMVAREFRLRLPPGRRVVPEPMLSLRVRGGLPMTVQRV
jgi:cytochrome P450